MSDTAAQLQAFWNQRYAADAYAYGTAPNDFLVSCAPHLPAGGRVLCLADGEGRNSVWLARQGFDVTAVDIADQGLRKAERLAAEEGVRIATRQADVTAFDLGRDAWDAIVSVFLHLPPKARRALHARCVDALKPGGALVFIAYTPEQLACGTGGPKEAELLVRAADVQADFAGCSVEHAYEGRRRVVEGTLHSGDAEVAELLIRKPS